ncbi:MAG: aminotransferase class V-fold PLP-dependent enzyme, partial [Candidatus Komeilibacteria bacterium]|nr:aminotransferase class V-fold PLP-dependent enzyme [Candidatus Komeilibacteria bacterium]
AALARVEKTRPSTVKQLTKLRDWLISEISARVPSAIFTGHPRERLANNISFCFPGIEGEALVLRLSERGFACSAGSACASGSFAASHVLLALGLEKRTALASLRVSLGKDTKLSHLESFVKVLVEEVEKLQSF